MTYLTYGGYSLQCNSVEVLKEIIVYSMSSLTKKNVNIERLQGEELFLFPIFIFTLTVLSHI